jgi:hypothetical protein
MSILTPEGESVSRLDAAQSMSRTRRIPLGQSRSTYWQLCRAAYAIPIFQVTGLRCQGWANTSNFRNGLIPGTCRSSNQPRVVTSNNLTRLAFSVRTLTAEDVNACAAFGTRQTCGGFIVLSAEKLHASADLDASKKDPRRVDPTRVSVRRITRLSVGVRTCRCLPLTR